MKKTLLLSTALVVGVAGFAQSTAKKAINPKYLQKTSVFAKYKIAAEPQPSTTKSTPVSAPKARKGNQSTYAGSCLPLPAALTTSYNCFGVGGGATTTAQNCLSYNSDLNSVLWVQRGSIKWPLNTTSGSIQATIINPTTLVKDSVILYHDANTTHHARYPSGVFLNPIGNTNYQKAFAVGMGQVIDNGTTWQGTAYCPKPLTSMSARNHTAPTGDSLFASSITPPLLFGNCANANIIAAPVSDMVALYTATTTPMVLGVGMLGDNSVTCTNCSQSRAAVIARGILNAAGNSVTWSADTIVPPARKGTLGYQLGEPRMAFGPDGLHGYLVFLALDSTVYHNYSDSSFTPMIYVTTDGGFTWARKLAGYDWMCHHPEVEKNVGNLAGENRFYTFDEYIHGSDLTVDANNVLHYVTCVSEATFRAGPTGNHTVDSVGIFSSGYQYDYVAYHPIIWDFMTDGNSWSTMMVDSIISAATSSSTTDTTYTQSAMAGSMATLGVSSHITISRSKDGKKVFYGWADTDPNINPGKYNVMPDIYMKAYDVPSKMASATINSTNNTATCFYPYLSDISYQDASNNWVVPAVYTVGHVIANNSGAYTIYDCSSQADYYYSNCGSFNPTTDFTVTPVITAGSPTATCLPNPYVGIQQHKNAFESSISNYPNPFNNTTTIAVTLTENKNVDVKVYNAIGNLVFSKKVNGNVGENTVSFDGSALSSGVYYYTVTAGNDQATKKMIIQK